MKNADAWVKLLYTYGPFALLVFVVFVTEGKSRRAMNEATRGERKMLILFIGVYALNWIAIFGLVVYSVIAWKKMNLDRLPTITGTIENLPNSEILSTSFDDLYLHRIRQNNNVYSNYEWMLVSKEPRVDEGKTVVFTIDRSTPNSEFINDYELPIRSEFYDKKVRLRRAEDDLYLIGQEKPLVKRRKLIGPPLLSIMRERPLELFTTVVYAQADQSSPSLADFALGLESPDAIVRRQSRADLANQDPAVSLPWIDQVLTGNSSYRLRLGVIIALNNIPNLGVEKLLPSTIEALQIAVRHPDETLRNEAVRFLNKYRLVPAILFEHINYTGKLQAFGPGKYRADKNQLGNLPNDSASSLLVAKGYRVRLCENEGDGIGSGMCETYGYGWHPLKMPGLSDQVSYISVTKKKERQPD